MIATAMGVLTPNAICKNPTAKLQEKHKKVVDSLKAINKDLIYKYRDLQKEFKSDKAEFDASLKQANGALKSVKRKLEIAEGKLPLVKQSNDMPYDQLMSQVTSLQDQLTKLNQEVKTLTDLNLRYRVDLKAAKKIGVAPAHTSKKRKGMKGRDRTGNNGDHIHMGDSRVDIADLERRITQSQEQLKFWKGSVTCAKEADEIKVKEQDHLKSIQNAVQAAQQKHISILNANDKAMKDLKDLIRIQEKTELAVVKLAVVKLAVAEQAAKVQAHQALLDEEQPGAQ